MKRHNLYEDIAEEIVNQIRQGNFRPGDQLPGERELAGMLGVNRTTLREALRVLEFMRVVDKRVGEGVFVRDLNKDSSIELLIFRILNEEGLDAESLSSACEAATYLEVATAKLAALRATPEEVRELRAVVEKMETRVKDGAEFTEMDHDFHLIIGRLSKNPLLSSIVSTVWIIVKRYAGAFHQNVEWRRWSIEGHRAIVEAIASGDGGNAGIAMERHLQEAFRILFTQTRN